VHVDLNADLGEGFGRWALGDDEALLGIVTSANVACGFHAGDPSIMLRSCARAAARGVTVGAQVSYRDLAGFGRRFMDVAAEELTADIIYQVGALRACAHASGTEVRYVKPHGALYNAIVHHQTQADAVVEAVQRLDPSLPVLGLPGSAWLTAAEQAGLTTVVEAFADRAYAPDGSLLPRSRPGAVLTDPGGIAERCVHMVTTGEVAAVDGTRLSVRPESLCVHGDTPEAVAVATAVRRHLAESGVSLAAPAADR